MRGKDELGGTCNANEGKRTAYRLLVRTPEVKRPLGRPRYCWVDNIKSVRFEVFTAVTMKNGVFWVVTPCGSCSYKSHTA
jgi:hypothetical protein